MASASPAKPTLDKPTLDKISLDKPSLDKPSPSSLRCLCGRMAQFVGVVTVRVTEGLVLVPEPVLLETTPLASTPITVKV